MLRKVVRIVGLVGILLSSVAVSATPAGYEVSFPKGFRDWFVVNSMIVTKDSAMLDQIGGMHIIYVNAKGLPTLKKGGPFPYPDGTVFADDVHEFSVKEGSYVEGNKKAVTVMVKDAKKYSTTGGWGFRCGQAATRRNRWFPTRPTPYQLASNATHRRKIRTIRFRLIFPEIAPLRQSRQQTTPPQIPSLSG